MEMEMAATKHWSAEMMNAGVRVLVLVLETTSIGKRRWLG